MWTLFTFNPSSVFASFSDANANGSHTDWSPPAVLPTINGHPWDSYMLPTSHQTYCVHDRNEQPGATWVSVCRSICDCLARWGRVVADASVGAPRRLCSDVSEHHVPRRHRQHVCGRHHLVNGRYPLYVSWEDGSSGVSNIYLTSSTDAASPGPPRSS